MSNTAVLERPSEVRQAFRVLGDYVEQLERQLAHEKGARQRAELKWKAAQGARTQTKPTEPPPQPIKSDRDQALDLLGLQGQPSDNEIRQAYREKALELHPDAGGSTEAFHALSQALELLLQ